MPTPKLGSPKDLRHIYNMGALSGTQTMTNCTVLGDSNYPVRLEVKGARGEERYEFWTQDVDAVLNEALENGDSAAHNPNFPVLQAAFSRMIDFRDRLGHNPYIPQTPAIPAHIGALFERTRA